MKALAVQSCKWLVWLKPFSASPSSFRLQVYALFDLFKCLAFKISAPWDFCSIRLKIGVKTDPWFLFPFKPSSFFTSLFSFCQEDLPGTSQDHQLQLPSMNGRNSQKSVPSCGTADRGQVHPPSTTCNGLHSEVMASLETFLFSQIQAHFLPFFLFRNSLSPRLSQELSHRTRR